MLHLLQDLRDADRKRFGNKAVNLGILIQHGECVPPGYALSIEAHREFMESCGAVKLLGNVLANTDQICERIRTNRISEGTEGAIETVWQTLTAYGETVAVRSSAISEDTGDASYAGVYSSFTNLTEIDDVLQAIRECYASLYSDKAISACLRSGENPKSAAMAVILQQYIEGSPSGVLFTSDAVSMDDTHMVANAVAGPCSDMVEGNVDVAPIRIPRETEASLSAGDSNAETQEILTNNHIAMLRNAGLEIENILGPRQDIEWTFAGETLWVLQARSITTFREKADAETWDPHDGHVWDLASYTHALAPLEQEIVEKSLEGGRAGAVETGNTSVAADYIVQSGYLYTRTGEIPNQEANRDSWGRYVARQHTDGKNIYEDVLLPQIVEWQDRLDPLATRELEPEEIAAFVKMSIEYTYWISAIHWKAVWGTCYLVGCPGSTTFAEEFKEALAPFSSSEIADLVYAPTELSTTRRSLITMAEIVQNSSLLGTIFEKHSSNDVVYAQLQTLREGEKLLTEMESLYTRCWRYQTGTWREPVAPTVLERKSTLVGWIRPYLTVNPRDVDAAAANVSNRKDSVIKTIESLLNESETKQFQRALNLAEKAYRCRDDHAHFIDCTSRSYPHIAVLKAGRYLLQSGVLQSLSDVWLLNSNELRSLLTDKKRLLHAEDLELRRGAHGKNEKILPPVTIGPVKPAQSEKHSGDTPCPRKTDGNLVLQGISGLASVVRGTALVYTGSNLQLTEPVILVLPDVRSLDVIAYLDRLIGVIVETGSPYSHLGIISRELAIPCLFGVEGATEMIRSGDLVEIDGVAERVTRIS